MPKVEERRWTLVFLLSIIPAFVLGWWGASNDAHNLGLLALTVSAYALGRRDQSKQGNLPTTRNLKA